MEVTYVSIIQNKTNQQTAEFSSKTHKLMPILRTTKIESLKQQIVAQPQQFSHSANISKFLTNATSDFAVGFRNFSVRAPNPSRRPIAAKTTQSRTSTPCLLSKFNESARFAAGEIKKNRSRFSR